MNNAMLVKYYHKMNNTMVIGLGLGLVVGLGLGLKFKLSEPLDSRTIKPYVAEKRRQICKNRDREQQMHEMRRTERCASLMKRFNKDMDITDTHVRLPTEYVECTKEIQALGYSITYDDYNRHVDLHTE
jgi:hypothetical protein